MSAVEQNMNFFTDSVQAQFGEALWDGTFEEFLDKVIADPYRATRTSFQIINDMVHYYGHDNFEDSGETVTHYHLFDDPFDQGLRKIFGLERTIMRLVKYIRSAALEEGKERIFVFHGPVGTAKTSMIELIGRGLEDYSRKSDGECFTYRWVFGRQLGDSSANLGFGARHADDPVGEVVASIPNQFHENPLLLIPKKPRREFLEKCFREKYGDSNWFIPHKILEGELNYNDRQIFDYLLKYYSGDWRKVMQHVRIERFTFSEAGGRGVAKVFPEGNVDTKSAAISFDENYRFLANMINSLNLVKFMGKYVMGNRGMIHYSDIFKKPVHYLQHLLAAVEEHKVDFGDINVDVDCLIIGTTNVFEYQLLRAEQMSKALRSRMRKIDVPYLLSYGEEKKIYDVSLRQARRYRHIAPHTTDLAAMFAVLTRLEKSRLHDLVPETLFLKLNRPIAKALLYNGELPADLTPKEQQSLTRDVRRRLRNEHPIPDMLEGMRGIPTRILQNIFADLCEEATDECITPFSVFRILERVIEQGPINYDFLSDEADEGFHDPQEFVRQLRHRYRDIVSREVEHSLVNVSQEEMESRIREYLAHVSAYNKKEKVRNPSTGAMDEPSEPKMRAIEELMNVERSVEETNFWRFKVITRASAHVKPGEALNLREVYGDIYDSLYQSLYREKRRSIVWSNLQSALEKVRTLDTLDDDLSDADPTTRKQVRTLLTNMMSNYNYCFPCARQTALYFINSLS